MKTTRTPESKCLCCGKKIVSHSSLMGNYTPKPGDFSVCFGCGTICNFDDQLNLVKATREDLHLLAKESPDLFRELHTAAVCVTDRILLDLIKNN